MPNTRADSLRYVAVSLFLFLALAIPTTAIADIITLKLPGITGDVTVVGQEDTIEVLSLSGNIQGTKGQTLPVFSDFMIQKRLDRSSPALFLALVRGQLFDNAVINFLHETGNGFIKSFKITLFNVSLTKFSTDDSEGNVLVGHEQINLNYQKIQLKDVLTGESACWNIPTATSC